MATNCIFCKIIRKEINAYRIYEDKNFLGILDRNPIQPGHILLIPKNHKDEIFSTSDDSYIKLLLKAKELAVFMKKKINSKRIGLAIEGFGVPHIHIHLVPVNNGNELNPEKAKSAPDEELKTIKEQVYGIHD
ncbi:MAG: HIT family protein [Candidatus Woesearchaeota archaeon]